MKTPPQYPDRVWDAEDGLLGPRDDSLSFCHSVLASCSLPYRDPGPAIRYWERRNGNALLAMEAGRVLVGGEYKEVPLPFGPRSRLILLSAMSSAIKRKDPVVELGGSFTQFAKTLGIAVNGRNLASLQDQMVRLAALNIRVAQRFQFHTDQMQGPLFRRLQVRVSEDENQLTLFPETIEFSQEFYKNLTAHAVPLRAWHIKTLRRSARSIDIYVWLAFRLWRIPHGETVLLSWRRLREQFGDPKQGLRTFRRQMEDALKQVLKVYDRAEVAVTKEGLILMRSPPVVPLSKRHELLVSGKAI